MLALPVVPDGSGAAVAGPGVDDIEAAWGIDSAAVLDLERATGRTGEIVGLPSPTGRGRVLLVGVGEQRPADFRRAAAVLARRCADHDLVATTIPALAADSAVEPFVVGLIMGSFGFQLRSTGPASRPARRVVLCGLDVAGGEESLRTALAIGGASWRSRVLARVPANIKSPAWLAGRAVDAAEESDLEATIWDETTLRQRGFGGLLAVGQASATPPRLIRLDYRPAKGARRAPLIVVVGKGVTFDTGGLAIKPLANMASMRRDMTGGGVVISVLAALRDLGCPLRVTGLVPAVENAIGGAALRPGDVVTHFGGRTTEVTNPDAEGRVILADALAYAVAELKPHVIVDVATLTGAARLALGQRTGALFSNDDRLARGLLDAGEVSGEPLWRLPLLAQVDDALSSGVADADNCPAGPGAIVAARFLQHFTGSVPWAHLDLGSVGDSPSRWWEWDVGPTGFGARLLLEWLRRGDPLAAST